MPALMRRTRERLFMSGWPILQATGAAGLAWLIARALLDHSQAVFAPFAAIVVLLGGVGGRARRALQVIGGVAAGVLVGELLLGALGVGPFSLMLAAGAAMLLVAPVTDDPLPPIQAGIAAAVVVTMNDPASGPGRLGAALLGGLVALVFTQILFTPSPVRLLGKATSELLRNLADALDGRREISEEDLAAGVTALTDARNAARATVRHSLRGRWEAARCAALDDRVAHLPALVFAAVSHAAALDHPHRKDLAAAARQLAADPYSPDVERIRGLVDGLPDGSPVRRSSGTGNG